MLLLSCSRLRPASPGSRAGAGHLQAGRGQCGASFGLCASRGEPEILCGRLWSDRRASRPGGRWSDCCRGPELQLRAALGEGRRRSAGNRRKPTRSFCSVSFPHRPAEVLARPARFHLPCPRGAPIDGVELGCFTCASTPLLRTCCHARRPEATMGLPCSAPRRWKVLRTCVAAGHQTSLCVIPRTAPPQGRCATFRGARAVSFMQRRTDDPGNLHTPHACLDVCVSSRRGELGAWMA